MAMATPTTRSIFTRSFRERSRISAFGARRFPTANHAKREAIENSEYDAIVAKAQILKGARSARGKHLGFYANFPTSEAEQIELKVGISFTSVEAARANFEAEVVQEWVR